MPKIVNFGEFLKTETCGQKVLPDRSVLIGQKLLENAMIKKWHFEEFSNNVVVCSISEAYLSIESILT